jgi:hypothetical protein
MLADQQGRFPNPELHPSDPMNTHGFALGKLSLLGLATELYI